MSAPTSEGLDYSGATVLPGTPLLHARSQAPHQPHRREAGDVPLGQVDDLGRTAMPEAIVLGDGSSDQVDVVRQLIGQRARPARGYRRIAELLS